jgi:hypothetical protein
MTAVQNTPAPPDEALVIARQTRNAVYVIAWVAVIAAAFAVIFGLVVGIQMIHMANSVNHATATCSTDPLSTLPAC